MRVLMATPVAVHTWSVAWVTHIASPVTTDASCVTKEMAGGAAGPPMTAPRVLQSAPQITAPAQPAAGASAAPTTGSGQPRSATIAAASTVVKLPKAYQDKCVFPLPYLILMLIMMRIHIDVDYEDDSY